MRADFPDPGGLGLSVGIVVCFSCFVLLLLLVGLKVV